MDAQSRGLENSLEALAFPSPGVALGNGFPFSGFPQLQDCASHGFIFVIPTPSFPPKLPELSFLQG